jgi:hypothetical protein
MGALRGVKSQRARDPLEKMSRDLDVATLLKPRVPGHADTSEMCHFLASQAARPATRRRGQPDLRRQEPLASASQKGGQIFPVRAAPWLTHRLSLLVLIPV